MAGEAVARARALMGTRFRLHGRDNRGIDCVGLVAAAHGISVVPIGYRPRTADTLVIERELASSGFRPADDAHPGDIMILAAGPAQLHLGIWTGDGLIHADAALRKVVETPGRPRWPVLGIWARE